MGTGHPGAFCLKLRPFPERVVHQNLLRIRGQLHRGGQLLPLAYRDGDIPVDIDGGSVEYRGRGPELSNDVTVVLWPR